MVVNISLFEYIKILIFIFLVNILYIRLIIEFIFYILLINGDWGLGIGDWAQSPIPNPQSPIPNPQSPN